MLTVLRRTAFLLTVAGLAFGQTTFSNNNGITTSASAGSNPYPSTISVSGLSGTISNVNVRLKGFTHNSADGLDLLLVGPTGQKFIFMSDAGRALAVSNITFTLSDSGATRLPNFT